jgi:hypothetical protein
MKCPVCKDYDFEHPLDLEKHALTTHGSSAEKLARESAAVRRPVSEAAHERALLARRDGEK